MGRSTQDADDDGSATAVFHAVTRTQHNRRCVSQARHVVPDCELRRPYRAACGDIACVTVANAGGGLAPAGGRGVFANVREARQWQTQADRAETEATELAHRVFRLLQLLCEGHHDGLQVRRARAARGVGHGNGAALPAASALTLTLVARPVRRAARADKQNFVRGSSTSGDVNLVATTSQFVSTMTTAGSGAPGSLLHEGSAEMIIQALATLSEFCQGPCRENQARSAPAEANARHAARRGLFLAILTPARTPWQDAHACERA